MASATEISIVIKRLENRIQQYTNDANYLESEGRVYELKYTTEQVVDILKDILGEMENE